MAAVKVYGYFCAGGEYEYGARCRHCPDNTFDDWTGCMTWALGHLSLKHPQRDVVDPDIEWYRLEAARFKHELDRLDNDNRSTR